MRELPALAGMPVEVAVWRLLATRGTELPLAQLREQAALDDSLESLQLCLAQHRLDARAIVLDGAADVAALETPTLLQARDGGWLLLRGRRRGRATVEDASGLHELPVPALLAGLGGQALELAARMPDRPGLWPRLRQLVSGHRRLLAQFVLASLALQLLALLTPELTGAVMGKALPDGASGLLHLLAMAVVVTAAFTGGVAWLRERVVLFLLTRIEVAFKRGLLDHVLRLPFAELQRRSLGELLQAFYGLGSARTLVAERVLGALFDGLLAIGFLVLMGVKLLAPTLAMLLAVLVMVAIAVLAGRAQARLQSAEVVAQARQRGYLTEVIAGIHTIKVAGAERLCHREWARRFGAERELVLRRSRIGLWTDVGVAVMQQATTGTLMLWGGHAVLAGQIGLGALFSFLLLAEGFLAAMQGLISTGLQLVMVSRQLTGVRELLLLPALPATSGRRGGRLAGPIVMDDVWFRYSSDGPWILQGYNLRIEPGAKHRLEGPSGCGKSTILRLLAGLYLPERGTITIAGREVHAAASRLRYLPQFVQLNAGSIIDNLRMLSGGASAQRLHDAAARTGFHHVAGAMAMGYQTVLPLGGRSLSGGQRQLLALTATLASECDLLLLDEPTANIDPVTQAQLANLLAQEARTIVSVVHA